MHNKINRLYLYITLIAVFFVQLTMLDFIRIFGARPDIGVIFVIFFAVFFGAGTGLEAGFFFGLLKDVYSTDICGVNTLTLALTGFLAGALSPKIFKESRLTQIAIVFSFTFFSFLFHFFLQSVFFKKGYIRLSEYIIFSFIPCSFYTAAISAALFPLLTKKYRLEEEAEYL